MMPGILELDWALKIGDMDRQSMSVIHLANDSEWIIGYVICEARNVHQRKQDIATAVAINAVPCMLRALKAAQHALRDAGDASLRKQIDEAIELATKEVSE
jgi:hypothetical protein